MQQKILVGVAAAMIAALLCGCSGGDGDNDSKSSSSATTNSVTLNASLGAISNATARVYQADGSTLLATAEIGSNSTVTIDVGSYSGPIVATISGDADAQYFDEASHTLVNLPQGSVLHAIAPAASGTVAITTLTELAWLQATQNNLFPLDASEVNQVNELVRSAFAAEITSILAAPTTFDANTTSGALANTDAGKYALKLAALAQLGTAQAAPALSVMQALSADLSDGVIDGVGGSGAINPPYTNFVAQLIAALNSIAAGYANSDLLAAVASFAPPNTALAGGTAGGDNTGGGDTGSGNTGGGNTGGGNSSCASVGSAGSATLAATSANPATGNGTLSVNGVLVEDSGLANGKRVTVSGTVADVCVHVRVYYDTSNSSITNVSYSWPVLNNEAMDNANCSTCTGASVSSGVITLSNVNLPDGFPDGQTAVLNGSISAAGIVVN